ncbi:GNAT family [Colletotrichum plurivorum]|uniref:GNAT family n=1 Tax=Colletotrichum plurivorum TaxID=2175906 RepID=A0A8H6JV15_9PEZI|nr:GNAT family [Colletotrichum plurivorum]
MSAYIRPLSIRDLDQSAAVEAAAFTPSTAASREAIEYRLSVCPELCLGLFVPEGTEDFAAAKEQTQIPVLAASPDPSRNDALVAHVLATKATTRFIKDEDMDFPPTWKADPAAQYDVGHKPEGKTIGLHALAVLPSQQRSGFGKKLMIAYIEHMRENGQADRISILTYDNLVSYYEKLGFTHYGTSDCKHAGVAWQDLAYEYSA